MTTTALILSLVAVPLWMSIVNNLLTLTNTDAAGQGLAVVFTFMITVALWILLALALILAWQKAALPTWSSWAAFLLLPASCAATLAVISLFAHRDSVRWMIIVPVLAPPLLMVFTMWASLPGLRMLVPAPLTAGVTWGVLLILSCLPWPRVAVLPGIERARIEQYKADREKNLAEFQKLPPDSPVWEWLNFTSAGYEFRDRAMGEIRRSARRQQDIETMLARSEDAILPYLGALDLHATPALCQEARRILTHKAGAWRSKDKQARFLPIRAEVEQYDATLAWLAKNDCPVLDVVNDMEAAVRSYPDWEEGILFLAHLEDIRQQH
jgi:hypothetical protein